ncbi:MAG: hydroxyacid dehydrogenase [Lachnospiraceae bacterium]|nr:hydroxyacid dehydrogenase [Lachnospiraceae bacterium]
MKIVVLDAETFGTDLDLSPLSGVGETTVYPITPADLVAERISDAEVVIINKVKLNETNLAAASSLKLICIMATGYDNVDTAYCRSAGIAVCNVVGYSTHNVAQLTVAMVMSLINRLPEYTEFVRSGAYTASGIPNKLEPVYHEICGKKWGIIGYGNIGKQVGRVAEAMGCELLVYKRTPEPGAPCVDLETLCRESDVISVHTPLNDGTRGLIDAAHIAMMKKDVIFINVARGAVTDEAALAAALKEGKIGALGVDVYSVEPFSADHPFNEIKALPNVCLTPHMAWGSYEARVRCLSEVIKNIGAYYAGERRCRVD